MRKGRGLVALLLLLLLLLLMLLLFWLLFFYFEEGELVVFGVRLFVCFFISFYPSFLVFHFQYAG